MSWIGWLMLLGMFGVLVLVVRGIIQVVSWLVEEYIIEPRELRRRNERLQAAATKTEPNSDGPSAAKGPRQAPTAARPPPRQNVRSVRKPSRIARWLTSLIGTILKKDYDYWRFRLGARRRGLADES